MEIKFATTQVAAMKSDGTRLKSRLDEGGPTEMNETVFQLIFLFNNM